MALGFKGLAEVAVIVDFPVEDEDDRTVLIKHGLMSALDVNDAETPVR